MADPSARATQRKPFADGSSDPRVLYDHSDPPTRSSKETPFDPPTSDGPLHDDTGSDSEQKPDKTVQSLFEPVRLKRQLGLSHGVAIVTGKPGGHLHLQLECWIYFILVVLGTT